MTFARWRRFTTMQNFFKFSFHQEYLLPHMENRTTGTRMGEKHSGPGLPTIEFTSLKIDLRCPILFT